MSEQTAKVVKVRENIKSYPNKMDKTGKNPNVYVHGITLENDPQEWEYHSVAPTCIKFQPQQEATFTTEVKQNGSFTNHKISPAASEKPAFVKSFNAGGAKYEPKNQEVITGLSCASTAANFYQQRQGTEEQVVAFAEKLFNWAMSKSKV